jgi:polyisoprenoid-binding protein YceI
MRTQTSIPRLTGLTVLALGLALAGTASAQSRTFAARNDGGSRIQFVSDAPLETITGVSSHVTGELNVDPANLSTARGTIRVRVDTIRTGIDLRDEHLRAENWLDAGRYPDVIFEITRVEGAQRLEPNRPANLRLHGRFTLHGVTREIVANAQVRFIPLNDELRAARVTGDVIRGQANFTVQLTDYNVSVPAIVRLKVANEIRVNVTLRAIADGNT